VPVADLQKFITEWESLFSIKYPNWELYVFGHFGDGNLHIHAVKPPDLSVDDFYKNTQKVDADLFNLVRKFGGSVSAEHGIGVLKKPYLKYSKSEQEIEIFRQVKRILDPKNLLNPGKII
jgi:FAD/FMN-containing dehydrogenase